jgi:hypothetical protein
MKKLLLFFTLFSLIFSVAKAQETDAENQSDTLLIQINALSKEVNDLQQALQQTNRSLKSSKIDLVKSVERQNFINDSIGSQLAKLNQGLKSNITSLDQKLSESVEKTESGLIELKGSLSSNTIYWIIATSFAIVLAVLLFFLLRRSIKTNDQKTMQQLQSTRKSLEEEGIKLDKKLLELLEKQLKIGEAKPKSELSEEFDHSLALKVADEIVRIQKNLSMMKDSIKGKKQLDASVERIRSNFEANGYEIPNLIGQNFDSGDKIIVVNSIPDENLKSGDQVISRIIKPQVNYNRVMIQAAQVEVKVGI